MCYTARMKHILIALSLVLSFGTVAAKGNHLPIKPQKVVPFSAKSFLVADHDGNILKEQEGDTVRPIASISKLMVGLIAADQNLDEQLAIPKQRQVTSTIPRNIATLTRKELLTLALVKSDNFAAQILCNNIPDCIQQMNGRARDIGMLSTRYVEPTGLSSENVSTAHDLLKLLLVASIHPVVTELSRMPNAEIDYGRNKIKVNNTNPLTARLNILLSKTGFTNPAGGCLVMIANTAVGERIYVLLGSRNAKTRIPDMESLVKGS